MAGCGGGGAIGGAFGDGPESKVQRKVRVFFIDNLLVRIHFIIVMIRWTGLAPWEFEFPFAGSLTSTFLVRKMTSRGNRFDLKRLFAIL